MWACAGVNGAGLLLSLWLTPETKGRTLESVDGRSRVMNGVGGGGGGGEEDARAVGERSPLALADKGYNTAPLGVTAGAPPKLGG